MRKHNIEAFNSAYRIILFCMLTFVFVSCQRNSDMQGEGEVFLQGSWTTESVPNQDQLLRYELIDFRFNCDSVFVKIKTYSKAKMDVDSCYGNGEWAEYARGVYSVRGDSLIVQATYTNENWRQKLSGCHHIGQYLPRFKIVKQTKDSLYLENRFSHNPVQLRKTETTTCVPQKVY